MGEKTSWQKFSEEFRREFWFGETWPIIAARFVSWGANWALLLIPVLVFVWVAVALMPDVGLG